MSNKIPQLTEMGAILRAIRQNKKMTQGSVAQMAGISQVYLCNIEKGKSFPSLNVVSKICTALEVPVSAVLFKATTVEDVAPAKRDVFIAAKPAIDNIIQNLIGI